MAATHHTIKGGCPYIYKLCSTSKTQSFFLQSVSVAYDDIGCKKLTNVVFLSATIDPFSNPIGGIGTNLINLLVPWQSEYKTCFDSMPCTTYTNYTMG